MPFFAVDYQITPRTRDADDGLRRLMRQLLVSGLVNHPAITDWRPTAG